MTSRARAAFPLNSDIVDRLVTFLPDLRTLFAFALANGYIYDIFESRHRTLLYAVSLNQFGPTLPQALRAARAEAAGLTNCNIHDVQNESEVLRHDITKVEAGILARNAPLIDELEDLYSWRLKDRTSKQSRLTSLESLRFKRAMYRVMLIWILYGLHSESQMKVGGYYFWSHPHLDVFTELQSHIHKQKEILLTFTTREVDEIRQAKAFLCKLALWALAVDEEHHGLTKTYGIEGVFLFAGPKFILDNYHLRRSRFELLTQYTGWPGRGPCDGFLGNPIEDVLHQRMRSHGDYIPRELPWAFLDVVNGQHDVCEHCSSLEESFPGEKHGVKLWNETNWDFMKGYVLLNLPNLMPGKLRLNESERDLTRAIYRENFSDILQEMFELRTDAYRHWRTDQWVCVACLSSFIHDMIVHWWLWRKRQPGQRIEQDCWYGYNCPYQDDLGHTDAYNHLCGPPASDTSRSES